MLHGDTLMSFLFLHNKHAPAQCFLTSITVQLDLAVSRQGSGTLPCFMNASRSALSFTFDSAHTNYLT